MCSTLYEYPVHLFMLKQRFLMTFGIIECQVCNTVANREQFLLHFRYLVMEKNQQNVRMEFRIVSNQLFKFVNCRFKRF